jgi:hypothetical protein
MNIKLVPTVIAPNCRRESSARRWNSSMSSIESLSHMVASQRFWSFGRRVGVRRRNMLLLSEAQLPLAL